MIRFEDVAYTYRTAGSSRPALGGVNLTLAPGELVAVLGANGSGKSTLALLSNGLLVPDGGSVSVDDALTTDESFALEARTHVGLVFQNPDNQIVGSVVEEDVAFGPENLGVPTDELRERVDSALGLVGLEDLARREPHLLSGGQKQRLAIAGALAMNPTYLILDEPLSMLDPVGRAEVLGIIDELAQRGHGVLHVTHSLIDAASADRLVVLDAGAIVFEGVPGEAVARPQQLAEWGIAVPPMARLAAALRDRGIAVPSEALQPEQIAEALWG